MKDSDLQQFDDDDLEYTPRSKTPIIIVLLLAILGGAGYFAWSVMTAVEPLRVLVAIDFNGQWYEGSKPAAKLVDDVSAQLKQLGFEPVEGGDPAVMATLENAGDDLRSAAKSLKAAWVVGGRVKATATEHPVGDEPYYELEGVADIEIFHVNDPESAVIRHQTRSWSGSKTKDRAISILAGGVAAEKIGAKVVPSMVNHPRIATALFGEGKDKKGMDAQIAGKLRKAEQYANASHSKLSTAKKTYAALKIRRMEAEKGPVKVTYHGTMSEDDGLIGAGPKGFLVKTEDEELYVDPDNNKLRRLEQLETLAWKAPVDEPTAEVLWKGYNIYSYPGVTNDGQVAALVEDIFGWAKTVTLIHADGRAKRLKIDPDHRFSSLKPSPTGKSVALYDRDCRKCDSRLLVLDAEGNERFKAEREGGTFHGFAWLSDDVLLVMHTPARAIAAAAEAEAKKANDAPDDAAEKPAEANPTNDEVQLFKAVDQTIWTVDLSGATPKLESIQVVDLDVKLSWVRVSHDFKKAVFSVQSSDGPSIGVLDIAARTLLFHSTPGETSAPTFSPDGKWITFNIWPGGRGDEEIGLMKVSGGEAKILTKNRFRDRYPYFSHDSKRIFFESLDKDPNFNGRRSVSVIASVEVPGE